MYKVLFQNENIIAVEKEQGFPCEPSKDDGDCLIDAVKRTEDPSAELCHRLDRNTGGIVLMARSSGILELMEQAQKDKLITKTYAAVVVGNAFTRFGDGKSFVTLKAYHFKDAKLGRVYIYDSPRKLARPIETRVRPVTYYPGSGTTLLEVILGTGRTHQIRAHLAHTGFPVAGDGKYGKNTDNKRLGFRYQALWAKKIEFDRSICEKTGLPRVLDSTPRFETVKKKG